MKKTVTAHLMVLLLSCVSICQTASFAAEPTENTQSETGNLFAFCEDEIKEFADHFDETQIVSLVYRRNHEASQETIITDPASIRRVWEALGQISVIGITQEYVSDWDDIFCFTLPDANAYRFAFNAKHLEVNGVCYELSGDEDLWLLADDLAQLQYNDAHQLTEGGELYYGIYPMLTPMYASEYADFMMQQLLPGITITFEEEQPGTDEQVLVCPLYLCLLGAGNTVRRRKGCL